MERTMKINHLPAYTYGWLHLNNSDLTVKDAPVPADLKVEVPVHVVANESARIAVPTGAGDALTDYLKDVPVLSYDVLAGSIPAKPLRIRTDYAKDAQAGNVISLHLNAGTSLVAVMDLTSEATGFAALQTLFELEEDSHLTLVQILRPGEQFTLVNDIGGRVKDRADVHIIHVMLGGKEVYQGCRVNLEGRHSDLKTDIGYRLQGESKLDMNYYAYHTGKKTSCEIQADGVLADHAKKVFRGTIDFINGCAGSVGDEREDVLLLSDDVVNQTIPLILCAEEDVEGNHGATIGRLDEDALFYAESRGMDEASVIEMMASARIDAVIKKIPDETTRTLLLPKEDDHD